MDIRSLTLNLPSSPAMSSYREGSGLVSLLSQPTGYPQTPPKSASGSPQRTPESNNHRFSPSISTGYSPLPSIRDIQLPPCQSIARLPSLQEFDQGVEALARSLGPVSPPTPPMFFSKLTHGRHQNPYSQSIHHYQQFHDPYQGFALSDQYDSGIEGYPSPPLDGESRHINQKYTTEQGDFIIYAWHDKKMKWQRIKQDFAAMFGTKPKRTVQGLQAWYYRMNQRIPLWDKDGWLIFDNDEDLEPRQISIKCRESNESLGLAERYPERAIHYKWVDAEFKRKARDWAVQRNLQYNERERRRRKEQRRLKL